MTRRTLSKRLHIILTNDADPYWSRIVKLFHHSGVQDPPTRLRDELVVLLDHALNPGPVSDEMVLAAAMGIRREVAKLVPAQAQFMDSPMAPAELVLARAALVAGLGLTDEP